MTFGKGGWLHSLLSYFTEYMYIYFQEPVSLVNFFNPNFFLVINWREVCEAVIRKGWPAIGEFASWSALMLIQVRGMRADSVFTRCLAGLTLFPVAVLFVSLKLNRMLPSLAHCPPDGDFASCLHRGLLLPSVNEDQCQGHHLSSSPCHSRAFIKKKRGRASSNKWHGHCQLFKKNRTLDYFILRKRVCSCLDDCHQWNQYLVDVVISFIYVIFSGGDFFWKLLFLKVKFKFYFPRSKAKLG